MKKQRLKISEQTAEEILGPDEVTKKWREL
jgi:hypothetical protein